MAPSDPWRIESDSTKQALSAGVMLVLGLGLIVGCWPSIGPRTNESLAGLLLGVLLSVIGLGALLFGGRQIVTVDPQAGHITIEHINRVRRTVQRVPLCEVTQFALGELGDREGGSVRYYVIAKLGTGKEIALFVGFTNGSHDRATAQARCDRLNQYRLAVQPLG
jgi:hypothetical protein